MQIRNSALVIAAGIHSLTQAEPILKRAPDFAIGKLYGYGTNISGLPLFTAGGQTYLGNVSLSTLPDASNTTFLYIGNTGEILANTQFTDQTGTTTTNTSTTDVYLAIDTVPGASEPVLIESVANLPGDYTTANFYQYGPQITWRNPNATIVGAMETNFYAVETDTDGIWAVYWDADSHASARGNVVVLKILPR